MRQIHEVINANKHYYIVKKKNTNSCRISQIFLLYQVAGAMSEMKKSMRDIFIMCRAMIIASLSAVFCKDHFVRFGTDINGIGGKNKGKMDVHELITDMMAYITDAKRLVTL